MVIIDIWLSYQDAWKTNDIGGIHFDSVRYLNLDAGNSVFTGNDFRVFYQDVSFNGSQTFDVSSNRIIWSKDLYKCKCF